MTSPYGNTCAERVEAEYFDQDDGTCWQCAGLGYSEECFEDVCTCLEPPCCLEPCDICGGTGRAP